MLSLKAFRRSGLLSQSVTAAPCCAARSSSCAWPSILLSRTSEEQSPRPTPSRIADLARMSMEAVSGRGRLTLWATLRICPRFVPLGC